MSTETTPPPAEIQPSQVVDGFVDERPYPGYVSVDLLPESVREKARIRRIKKLVAALIAFVFLLLAALWLQAQREIQSAQEQLDAAQATNAQLRAQVAQYSNVPAAFAAADQANAALSEAMAREVRWSFLLNQLSFATPAGVTLDSISGQIAEGSLMSSPGNVLPPKAAVGTITFAGTASTFAAVAEWLDSLETLKDYTYPFLTSSSKDDGGKIAWDSTANLSLNALTGRYGTPEAPAQDGTAAPASPTPAPEATAQGQDSASTPNDAATEGSP